MPGTQNNTFMEASASNGVVLFGKYEILELAGVGASAKVYHARRVDTGESVAVKAVSKRQLSTRDGYAEQIEREISIMRRMHHPHTVRLFEVLATKAKIYYVMEYAAGGELLRRVSSAGRMTENLARRYFQQLISAVAYCHSHGVFHRDLKLENLLVDENMDLKVTDFGLSAGRSQFGPDGLLHTICGTPAYVAPEILAKKGYRGGSVDIWSCGVILFTIVAGLLDRDPETRITIDEILKDPWFCRGGYKYPTRVVPELDEDHVMLKDLNAFDLISFSSGFDISGLLTHSEYLNCVERFVSKEEPESILERVKIMGAKMERVRVEKDENACAGVRLEGLDGNYVIAVRIYRLMNELVVIEVKRKEKKVGGGNFWRTRLKPLLLELALR
ncbi:hypothetical protein AAHE18_02G149900 [Arachis hypogaea]